MLENEGIRFYFQNETIMSVLPSNAFGGILLKVHPDDLSDAEEIWERFKNNDPSKLYKIP